MKMTTIILIIITILLLASGCFNNSNSTVTLPDSPYPADVIGHVVITESIQNWWLDDNGDVFGIRR